MQRCNLELSCSLFRTKRPALEKHVADSELVHLPTRVGQKHKTSACAFGAGIKLEEISRDLVHAFELVASFVERAEFPVFFKNDDGFVIERVLAQEWSQSSRRGCRFGLLGD